MLAVVALFTIAVFPVAPINPLLIIQLLLAAALLTATHHPISTTLLLAAVITLGIAGVKLRRPVLVVLASIVFFGAYWAAFLHAAAGID